MPYRFYAILCLSLMLGILSTSTACDEHVRQDPALRDIIANQGKVPVSGQLGPGDKIAIKVLYEEALSGEFTVSPEGTITYPYVGRLTVTEKTCLDIEDDITKVLKSGYLAEPNVSCSIQEYNSRRIFVFGEVRNPGTYPYRSKSTIVEAIALAGGFTERAQSDRTRLTREVDDAQFQVEVPVQQIIEGYLEDVKVLPGDIIFVPVSAWR